jgi:hypothetical protein
MFSASWKLSASWETAVAQILKDFPVILRNIEFHYYVHKSRPPVPNIIQINPLHTT